MSLLVWNCRGLGNPRTEDQLAELVWAKDPAVVFLAETQTDKDRLVQVQRRIEFKNMIEVPRRNKAGGLVIFWKEDLIYQLRLSLQIILIPRLIRGKKMNGDSQPFMENQMCGLGMNHGQNFTH